MAGEGDVYALVISENVVKDDTRAEILSRTALRGDAIPQWVVVNEARLELIRREVFSDISLVTAVVASVDADAFSKKLLDNGDEVVIPAVRTKIQAGESNVGGGKTPEKRARIEAVRRVDLLLLDPGSPESVGNLSLHNTGLSQVGIFPC